MEGLSIVNAEGLIRRAVVSGACNQRSLQLPRVLCGIQRKSAGAGVPELTGDGCLGSEWPRQCDGAIELVVPTLRGEVAAVQITLRSDLVAIFDECQ